MTKILVGIFLFLCCIEKVSANHLYGGELYYTYISGNQYKVTMVLYGDCSSTTSAFPALYSASPAIQVYKGSTLYRTMNLKVLPGAGAEVTPVCTASIGSTSCNGGTVPGVRRFAYADTITLSDTSANWKFRSTGSLGGTSSGRSTSITNIVTSSGSSVMSLEATLNNRVQPNSNPTYTTIPTPFFCINVSQEYNPGAVDSDPGDSLTYSLVDGLDASTTPSSLVTYLTGYSATAPLATATGTFSFSSSTGQLTFTPNLAQKSLVVCKVNEYHSGVLVGTSMREMTFIVLSSCSNRSPYGKISSVSGGTITGNTTVSICKNETMLNFNINPVDSDGNAITMTVAGLPGSSTLTISGSGTTSPTSSFSWNISSVAPGSYNFFVTYQDDGCPLSSKQTVAYTITVLASPAASVNIISTATCTKKAVIDIVPSGGTAPWTVKIYSGSALLHSLPSGSGTFRDSVAPGAYTVNITNTEGCSSTTNFTINNPVPPEILSFTVANPLCNGVPNGTAVIVAKNGLAPYAYSMDAGTFGSSGSFSSLSAGSHTIHIKDANNCTKDTSFTLDDPQPITLSSSVTRPMCNPYASGIINASAGGGTPPYLYALGATGTFSTTSVFGSLTSDVYIIRVKDANNCVKEFSVTVDDSIVLKTGITRQNVSCFSGADGSIMLSPSVGKPVYSYALGSGAYGTSSSFGSLSAGTYAIHIKDANGCILDTSATITQPTAVGVSIVLSNPTCYAGSNGVINVTASGGTVDYQYAIDGGTYTGTKLFKGLKAGVHKIGIKDANGCMKDTSVTLGQPTPLAISTIIKSALCFGDANGSIQVTGNGGTPSYLYSYGSGTPAADNLFGGLNGGSYLVTVTDQNGCKKDTNVSVPQPDKLSFDKIDLTNPTCEGYADGAIKLNMTGGTKPYAYSLDGESYSSANPITHLKENTYTVYVRDSNDCKADIKVTLVGYPKIKLDSTNITEPSCYGLSDAALTLYASGGNLPLRYSMVAGDTAHIAAYQNLKSKQYIITVTDSTNCFKSFPVTIGQPDPLKIGTDITNNDCIGIDTNGIIVALVKGGTRPYEYRWSIANKADSFIASLANGFYSLRVNDAHNCSDSVTSEIRYDDCCTPSIPNAFTPNGDGRNDVIRILYKGDIVLKEFSIYNRYGQRVFTTDNINQGWDGNFNGKEEELGAYYYYIRLICGNLKNHEAHFKGDITLIR